MQLKNIFSNRTKWELFNNEITNVLEKLKSDKENIIDLTISNPTKCNFDFPDDIIKDSFNHTDNLIYSPNPNGLLSAREAVSDYYRMKNIAIDPKNIFLTSSTSEGYSFLMRLLANPYDNMLFPRPSYPLFQFLSDVNDVDMRMYDINFMHGWDIDTESIYSNVDERTKGIVIVNPNNPTGSFAKRKDISEINNICSQKSIPIICDEVFLDFILDKSSNCKSLADNDKNLTFILSGISKILGMPQMKLSWIVVNGPEKLSRLAINKLEVIADTYLSVNTPVQNAFIEWMKKREVIQQIINKRLRNNLTMLENVLSKTDNIELLKPKGGWYAVLRISSELSEEDIALSLLKEDKVFVHPGYFFDFNDNSYIVVSLLPSENIFSDGIHRISSKV